MKVHNLITIELVPAQEYEAEQKTFEWSLLKFDQQEIEIEIAFNEPELISKDQFDNLNVQFYNTGYFLVPEDPNMQSAPNNFTLTSTIPP